MTRSYMVVFEKAAEDNWGAFTPDIPGAVGAGSTLEEARASVLEGISIILEDIVERGLPEPSALATSINFAEFDPDRTQTYYVIEWIPVELPTGAVKLHEEAQQAA